MGIRWLDFSGSPAILLPRTRAHLWHGYYRAVVGSEEPDLAIGDDEYVVDDAFDFANPRTDYDRVCSVDGKMAFCHDLGGCAAVAMMCLLDRLTWWQDELMMVNGGPLPSAKELSAASWRRQAEFSSEERDYLLLNSCLHGGDHGIDDDGFMEAKLDIGEYAIEHAEYCDTYVHYLFRFRKI